MCALAWVLLFWSLMEAGVSSGLAPEEPQTHIVLETLGVQQRLRHSVTKEIADLPLEAQPWSLGYSDRGAYVFRLGMSEWANKFLQCSLHKQDGKLFVATGGKANWLKDWLRASTPLFIRLDSLAVRGIPCVLKAHRLEHPVDNCSLMWELRYIHAFLGITGRWAAGHIFISDSISRWRGYLDKGFGLGYMHIRGSSSVCTKAPEEWMADACLPESTCSTVSFLLLLGHWCNSRSADLAAGALCIMKHMLRDTMQDHISHLYVMGG